MKLAIAAPTFALATIAAGLFWANALGQSSAPAAPSLAADLRYVARDAATGGATVIPERVIQANEEAIRNYNVEDREPVPPPPAEGLDVARLIVPALGVDSNVRRYGLDAAGRLDVPQDAATVGWQPAYSRLPGDGGATFFAAHFTYLGRAGVFYRLSTLTPGAEVHVLLTDGSAHTYRVTSVQDYELSAIDMGALLHGREGRESITLMTCSGPADQDFPYRTVVLAERVS